MSSKETPRVALHGCPWWGLPFPTLLEWEPGHPFCNLCGKLRSKARRRTGNINHNEQINAVHALLMGQGFPRIDVAALHFAFRFSFMLCCPPLLQPAMLWQSVARPVQPNHCRQVRGQLLLLRVSRKEVRMPPKIKTNWIMHSFHGPSAWPCLFEQHGCFDACILFSSILV